METDSVGKRIIIARIKRDIEQKDLAKRLGITASNLCLIEGNRHRPRWHVMCGLCRELGMTPNELIGDDYLTEAHPNADNT